MMPSDVCKFGVSGRIVKNGDEQIVLAVIPANDAGEACDEMRFRCPLVQNLQAEFLGLDGTDELAHAEDEWALRVLEDATSNPPALSVLSEVFEAGRTVRVSA